MARFYSNENFPLPVVVALRGLGHDVLTSLEAGQANRKVPDDQVVEFATRDRRAVLTRNRRHFAREHRRSANHAGIVTCTVDIDYAALAKRVHDAVANVADLNGKLDCIRSDNRNMPSTKQLNKKQPKSRVKASDRQLSNAALLKLATKNRPPQAWYDDETDPTKPAVDPNRSRFALRGMQRDELTRVAFRANLVQCSFV